MEHFFRHDYGRLVAMLVRRVGAQHIELVEDAVQSALMAALSAWIGQDVPEDPAAWLHKVAYNALIQDLRRRSGRFQILEKAAADIYDCASVPASSLFANEICDDMLRMLFVCCDDGISWESQMILALKTLCGFSTMEISHRLFTSEANVYKRLMRARDRLRRVPPGMETPALEDLRARLSNVHGVLYLLFNEGYLSTHPEQAIRRELCDEALRLGTLLAEHPAGAVPESFALLALMHLQVARFGSRVDELGGLLLLEEQDRALWDRERIALGLHWLQRSAGGLEFSRFHAEAGIAAEHCLAPSFRETRWKEIADIYLLLDRVAPSPTHTLNRAVAVAEWQGPQAGLALLETVVPPAWLARSHLWQAVMSDLHRRAGDSEIALQYREQALFSAPTDAVRALLQRRLRAPR